MEIATGDDSTAIVTHPVLEALEGSERARLLSSSRQLTLPPEQVLFSPGERCEVLPLVLSGEVRVQMVSTAGNEIVLYRIGAGELCTLSVGCLFTGTGYRAMAIVDRPTRALVVPAGVAADLLDRAPAFRRAILRSYSERLQDLMLVVEEVAFRRMDQRLAECLVALQRDGQLALTHQDLAVELGTAREVISRLLKEFERRDLVQLARGLIRLRGEDGLRRIAGGLDVQRTH